MSDCEGVLKMAVAARCLGDDDDDGSEEDGCAGGRGHGVDTPLFLACAGVGAGVFIFVSATNFFEGDSSSARACVGVVISS